MALILVSCGCDKSRQERTFTEELIKMLAWPEDGTYSDKAMQSAFDFIKENPQSLEYEFEEKLSHIRIATSEDGNVRAYSVERCGFGGNPSLGFECKTLLQYRSNGKVFCEEIENFNGYITRICHIDSDKYYLLEDYQGSIHQGTYETYNFYVYKIENNELRKVKGAFASKDSVSDNLELSWDDQGGSLTFNEGINDSVFIYSRLRKELYVLKGMPLIDNPLKYRQYNWNKRCFELQKYDEPVEFCNDKYFIRIEQQSEDDWTYKCWNGGQKQGKPDLVIEKGTKEYWLYDNTLISHDEWWTDDESSPLGEKYTFFNKGYRYEYYHGWSRGGQLEMLYVYDSGENLLYYGNFEPVQD
jgi:hypothetical protein